MKTASRSFLLIVCVLTACGGGGGGDAPPTPPGPDCSGRLGFAGTVPYCASQPTLDVTVASTECDTKLDEDLGLECEPSGPRPYCHVMGMLTGVGRESSQEIRGTFSCNGRSSNVTFTPDPVTFPQGVDEVWLTASSNEAFPDLTDEQLTSEVFPALDEYAVVQTDQTLAPPGATNVNPAFTARNNMRLISWALPVGEPPATGWPVVLYFNFQTKPFRPVDPGECKGPDCAFSRYLPMIQTQLLRSGFAVIALQGWQGQVPGGQFGNGSCSQDPGSFNTWFFSDDPNMSLAGACCEPTCPSDCILCNTWWPGADAIALQTLIQQMSEGRFGKIDMNRVSLSGYSAGATLVSRIMNEFPQSTLSSGASYPQIRASLLLSGGTYECYDETLVPQCQKVTGCCPEGRSEALYDDGGRPWNLHPATILAQTTNDDGADPDASVYYNDVMLNHAVPTGLVRQDLTPEYCQQFYFSDDCYSHLYFPKMVNPAVNFYRAWGLSAKQRPSAPAAP